MHELERNNITTVSVNVHADALALEINAPSLLTSTNVNDVQMSDEVLPRTVTLHATNTVTKERIDKANTLSPMSPRVPVTRRKIIFTRKWSFQTFLKTFFAFQELVFFKNSRTTSISENVSNLSEVPFSTTQTSGFCFWELLFYHIPFIHLFSDLFSLRTSSCPFVPFFSRANVSK